MMEEKDYCQYIISKCSTIKNCSQLTNGKFATPRAFLDAYESSSSYSGDTSTKKRKLIKYIEHIINLEINELGWVEPDVKTVLDRCLIKLKDIKKYDDFFTVAANYLWVMASKKGSKECSFSLTESVNLERRYSTEWISELADKIEQAQYDLSCMKEAENLPLGKQIFLGLVQNPDVAWYANPDNISYQDLKQQIHYCRQFLEEFQFIYYIFTATVIYREDLRRRYH